MNAYMGEDQWRKEQGNVVNAQEPSRGRLGQGLGTRLSKTALKAAWRKRVLALWAPHGVPSKVKRRAAETF